MVYASWPGHPELSKKKTPMRLRSWSIIKKNFFFYLDSIFFLCMQVISAVSYMAIRFTGYLMNLIISCDMCKIT